MQLLTNATLRAAAPSLRPQPMIYLHVPRQYKHINFVLLNDLVDLGLLLLLLACAYNNNRHRFAIATQYAEVSVGRRQTIGTARSYGWL